MTVHTKQVRDMTPDHVRLSEFGKAWARLVRPDLATDQVQFIVQRSETSHIVFPPSDLVVFLIVDDELSRVPRFHRWAFKGQFVPLRSVSRPTGFQLNREALLKQKGAPPMDWASRVKH